MPALRTLVHPRRARVQASALLPTFLSRFLSSTCKHHAALHPDPRCGRPAANLPCSEAPLSQECEQQKHPQNSHISNFSTQGTDFRPGFDLVGLTDHQDHALQHTCDGDACDSKDRGTLVSRKRPREKGQKKSESPEQRHGQVSVIASREQVLPVSLTALEKSRALESTSPEHLAAVLKVLEEFLGSSERASQALAANLGVLNQRSELLEQKLIVLAHLAPMKKVFRKVCTTPCVLSRKLESLYNLLHSFEEIGLTAKARNKVVWWRSRVTCGTGRSLLCASDFFKCVGVHETEVSRLLERRPSFFSRSVHSLMGYYTFFRQLGLSAHDITRVTLVGGLPTFAIKTLEERIKFLKDQGFSDSEVHYLIVRQPGILTLDCGYLKEKLNFLICEQRYDRADIVKCPACLTLSLQDRLIPRLTAVKERGLFKVYALSTILSCKDAVFQNKLRIKGK